MKTPILVKIFGNKKANKISSLILVFVFLFTFNTRVTNAQIVHDPVNFVVNLLSSTSNGTTAGVQIKNLAKDIFKKVLSQIARKVTLNMTQELINWGATGFKGDPFYVRDQKSFLKSIGDQQMNTFITEVSSQAQQYGSPFAEGIAKDLISKYSSSFANKSAFSLDDFVGAVNPGATLDNYYEDFNTGGWSTWFNQNLIQANNPIGAKILAENEIASRLNTAIDTQKEELLQNNGFLSMKKCVAYKDTDGNTSSTPVQNWYYTSVNDNLQNFDVGPFASQSTCTADSDSNQNVVEQCHEVSSYDSGLGNLADGSEYFNDLGVVFGDGAVDNCARYETTTPGSVISEQIKKVTTSPLEQAIQANGTGSVLADSIVNLASGVITQGLNNLIGSAVSSSTDDSGGPGSNATYVANGSGFSWDTGTEASVDLEDQINLGQASEQLLSDIDNTQLELDSLEKSRDLLITFPAKTLTLDQCNPGPDQGWQGRLNKSYQSATRKLNKKSDNDTNNGDNAVAALNRLDNDLDTEIRYISDSMVGPETISSSALIVDQVKRSSYFRNRLDETRNAISKKIRVLALLNDMKSTVEEHPSTLVDGVVVAPDSQNLSDMKKQYASIQDEIGNDTTVAAADAEFSLNTKEDFRAFQTTNPDSLISKCISQKAQNIEVAAKDTAQLLFCRFQNTITLGPGETQNGGLFGGDITNNTNITQYYPGDFTWDQQPYNGDKIEIECKDFYRSYLNDYTGDDN